MWASQTTHAHVSQPSAVGIPPAVVTSHTMVVSLKAGCVPHRPVSLLLLCIQHVVSLVLCCRFSRNAPCPSHLLLLYCLISRGAMTTTALTRM